MSPPSNGIHLDLPAESVPATDTAPDYAPVNKRLFVKPDRPVEKRGAIYVPSEKQQTSTALVLSSDSPLATAGDKVIMRRFWPLEMEDGTLQFFTTEEELVGVLKAVPPKLALTK